jgi:hypothetical protein
MVMVVMPPAPRRDGEQAEGAVTPPVMVVMMSPMAMVHMMFVHKCERALRFDGRLLSNRCGGCSK